MSDAAKPVWFILFVLVGLTTVVLIARSRSAGVRAGDGNGLVAWQNDVTAAREQSARDGKPVLLYFTADWCPPCQRMKSSTWVDSRVADAVKSKYIPVMVDIDAQGPVAQEFGVRSIPRVEILLGNGDRKLVTEGYLSPEEMVGALQ